MDTVSVTQRNGVSAPVAAPRWGQPGQVLRQLSYDNVDHKRISLFRASDYSEVVNLDVIALTVSRQHG